MATLSLDVITLGVPDVPAARDFYTTVLSPVVAADYGGWVDLDLHGTGRVGLYGTGDLASEAGLPDDAVTGGFRGYVVSYIVSQPTEVQTLLDAADRAGAKVLKPAKKGFFGGYSAVVQAPDGAVWKISAPSKKDTGPAGSPPVPTETAALLGVADPKVSQAFYSALGMTTDRDYGAKYLDFAATAGSCRLGFMTGKELAKDAGMSDAGGTGRNAGGTGRSAGVVLNHPVESRDEVDALMTAASAAGGTVAVPAAATAWGGYSGHFADPDGYLWKVSTT